MSYKNEEDKNANVCEQKKLKQTNDSKIRMKKWRENNKERNRKNNTEWSRKNRVKIRERRKELYKQDPTINERSREYKRSHPEMRRRKGLKVNFGITLEEYNEMLIKQMGVCKICLKPETSIDGRNKRVKALAVDHDHITGKIRGLLCYSCNIGIGFLKDSSDLLKKAAEYLEEHKENV